MPTFIGFGGDEENRTPDPLLARQVLSQLSYTPINMGSRPYPYFILLSSSIVECLSALAPYHESM